MQSFPALNPFATPFLIWTKLAWQAGEMAIASAQVIGHRTGRPVFAGLVPNASAQREHVLMVQEKGEVALQSAQAAYGRMLMLNRQFAALAMSQMVSMFTAMMSIATSRSPAESVDRQLRLVRKTVANAAGATAKLSGSSAQIVKSATKPVHARVTANAKRLGKKAR
jgi:hypothetical protein